MSQQSEKHSQSMPSNSGILVVIFITIAFILGWWGFCWNKSHSLFSFEKPQRISVMFKNADGLNEDANVFMDGVRIGCIEKIEWLSPQQVKVHLRILSKQTKIYHGAKATIFTNGIVGAKYVDVSMLAGSLPENEDLELLDENSIIIGEEPARTEVAIAKVAHLINGFDTNEFKSQWRSDRRTFVHAADRLSTLADKTIPLAERTMPLETEAMALSKDLRRTVRRLDKFLGNEHLSSDLKETAQKAKETAEHIQAAIHELNSTLTDKSLREDILSTFANLNDATLHIESSLVTLQETVNDKGLRSDIKQILSDARHTMDKVDEITSKPSFGSDFHLTLARTRDAVDRINLAAQQINQILDKRHPIIHLFLGRPGHVKTEEVEKIEYKKIAP